MFAAFRLQSEPKLIKSAILQFFQKQQSPLSKLKSFWYTLFVILVFLIICGRFMCHLSLSYTLKTTSIFFWWYFASIKCKTKMENFAGSRKVAHILKVWSLLSTKIPISSKLVENSSVMSHSPAAPPVFTNPAQIFFPKAVIH